MGEKAQGIRSVNDRYKIDRGMLRIVWEREKPKNLDPRKHTPRHIITTLSKIKDKKRILKAAREKEIVTYKGDPIRLSADFAIETKKGLRSI